MNDPIVTRKKLREVLALRPSRKFTEPMLLEGVTALMPERVSVDELRAAIEWNHSRGFIEFAHNEDLERDEWFLTGKGKSKEGLA